MRGRKATQASAFDGRDRPLQILELVIFVLKFAQSAKAKLTLDLASRDYQTLGVLDQSNQIESHDIGNTSEFD